MRKRASVLLAAAVLAAALSATAAAASVRSSSAAHASRAATVQLRHTRLGSILVSASGSTLYEFTKDRLDSDSCVKIRGCAAAWPPLQSSDTPTAGSGIRASLLSTIRLPDGAKQVTYAGHPLYLFSADTQAGDTSYVGEVEFGGAWDALSASAQAIR